MTIPKNLIQLQQQKQELDNARRDISVLHLDIALIRSRLRNHKLTDNEEITALQKKIIKRTDYITAHKDFLKPCEQKFVFHVIDNTGVKHFSKVFDYIAHACTGRNILTKQLIKDGTLSPASPSAQKMNVKNFSAHIRPPSKRRSPQR